MKKQILLAAALCGMTISMNAQIEPNKPDAKLGYQTKIALPDGDYKFLMDFATTVGYGEKISPSTKGLYGVALNMEGTRENPFFSGDCTSNNQGKGIKLLRFKDVDALVDSLTAKDEPAWSAKHNFHKSADVLLDVPGTNGEDQAWTLWGGMAKRRVMSFCVKLQDAFATLKSDLSFDILTMHPGTTGKTATYKMLVVLESRTYPYLTADGTDDEILMLDTITKANCKDIKFDKTTYVVDDIYTTSATDESGNFDINRVTINVAEAAGIDILKIANKKVSVVLYATTSGTDIQPGVFEPMIGIDNITGVYEDAGWVAPEGAIDGARLTQNVDVTKDEESPIVFNIHGKSGKTVTIQTGGDTSMKGNKSYYFKSTGCVKAKDAEGNYTIEVPYSWSQTEGDGNILKITDASYVNEELQVTMYANISSKKGSYELEISNGARFWLTFTLSTDATAVNAAKENNINVYTEGKRIVVKNATDNVIISNSVGQIVANMTAEEAEAGVTVSENVYIVKTGKTVKKVMVK